MASVAMCEFKLKSKDSLPYLKIIYDAIYDRGNTGPMQIDIRGMIKAW